MKKRTTTRKIRTMSIMLLMIFVLQTLSGCDNKDNHNTDVDKQMNTSENTEETIGTEEDGTEEINNERKVFIETYYPIMLEYNTSATEFMKEVTSFRKFYEQSGHDYDNQGVIDQLDIYFDLACEKFEECEDYLKNNTFFNDNILLFEKIFAIEKYEDVINSLNTIKDNYEPYRKDFLNGDIESGGSTEAIYDIGLLYIINAQESASSVKTIMNIKLEPKDTCYQTWIDYNVLSAIDEYETANQQLMEAFRDEPKE